MACVYTHTQHTIYNTEYTCLLTILMVLSIEHFLDIFKLICSIKRKCTRHTNGGENGRAWKRKRIDRVFTSLSLTHTGSAAQAHTSVAHNFQHITHFEVYASMFKSKGPCKNYHHTTHIHPKNGTFKTLRLQLYMVRFGSARLGVAILPMCKPPRYLSFRTYFPLNLNVSFLNTLNRRQFCWLETLFCSRNPTKSSVNVNIDEISNLKWCLVNSHKYDAKQRM